MGEINYISEFINALKENVGCAFIANNAHNFSKEELKIIILELLYDELSGCPNIEDVIEELEEYTR